MPILYINTGTSPNSGDGDSLRTAFHKLNQNLTFLVNQYVEAGVASVQGKQGIVVLDLQDIETALGYIPQDRALFDGQVTERLRGYLSTSSLASYGFLTSSTFETIVSQRAYTTPQAVRDIVSTSTLTLANLDANDFITLNQIVVQNDFSSFVADIQDRLNRVVTIDTSAFLTDNDISSGLYNGTYSPSTMQAINSSSFAFRLLNLNVTYFGRDKPVSTLVLQNQNNFGIDTSYSPYKNDTRTKFLVDRTSTDIISYKDVSQGTYTSVMKSLANFTTDGLSFLPSPSARLDRNNIAQNAAFNINGHRPFSPADRSGFPGQIYIPNAYEIETDPYIYICIDTPRLRFISPDGVYHRNWIRIPIKADDMLLDPFIDTLDPSKTGTNLGRWEGTYNNNFGLAYSYGGFRPSTYAYPNPEHENNHITYRLNSTYTATIQTMVYLHLWNTGNSFDGINFSNSFTYQLVDIQHNPVNIPGISLQIVTPNQQVSLFGSEINLVPTKRIEDNDFVRGLREFPGIVVPSNLKYINSAGLVRTTPIYTGTSIHLVGTPTQTFSQVLLNDYESQNPYVPASVYLLISDLRATSATNTLTMVTSEIIVPLHLDIIGSTATSKNLVVRNSGRGFELKINKSNIDLPAGNEGYIENFIVVTGGSGIIRFNYNTSTWSAAGLSLQTLERIGRSTVTVNISSTTVMSTTSFAISIVDDVETVNTSVSVVFR